MANLRTIQFLRNAQLYASLEAAKTALIAQAATAKDGSPIAGRYTVTVSGVTETRTVLGIVANGTVSFFNNDKEIDNILYGLDFGPVGYGTADVVNGVGQADGRLSAETVHVGTLLLADYAKGSDSGSVASGDSINAAIAKLENQIDAEKDARAAAIDALDYDLAADDNKVVVSLNQTDGVVSGTSVNISGIKLAGYAEGTDADIAATDTLGEALGKLQAQINAMDKAADAVAGQVVTTVTEADGKVTETKANVKDLQLGGYSKTNDTGDIASADTINVALSKLENKSNAITIANADGSINVTSASTGTDINVNIKSDEHVLAKDGNAGLYTDIKLSGITPSSTIVKEEYQLTATDGSKLGDSIKIYKDSHIVSINYITDPTDSHYQNLEYNYVDDSGNTQTEYVDMSALVLEAEFASGVTFSNGVAHGVVDQTSESFLTVGAGGFKVSGVSGLVENAIDALDADVSGNSTHVTVGVAEEDGVINAVTVTEDNIANADDLAELSGKTFTVATSSNASITTAVTDASDGTKSVDLITDADKIQMSGFTSNNGALSGIVESDSISTALEKVDTVITQNEEVTAAALTDLNTKVDTLSGKTFTEAGSANNSITFVESTAADGTTHIDAQTDASKISGLTAVANVANEISGVSTTDSVQTGIENLYASLAAEIEARKAAISATTVSSGNAGIVATPNASGTTVTLTLDDSTQGTGSESTGDYNALTITNDGLFLSTNWDCGTFNDSNP